VELSEKFCMVIEMIRSYPLQISDRHVVGFISAQKLARIERFFGQPFERFFEQQKKAHAERSFKQQKITW